MNKLRALSWSGGGFVAVVGLWAAVHYGSPVRFVPTVLIGIVASGLPLGLAHLKGTVRSLRRQLTDGDTGLSAKQGAIFVSDGVVENPVDCLEAVVLAVRNDETYDEVERDAFQEGPGLTVSHGGFNNSLLEATPHEQCGPE